MIRTRVIPCLQLINDSLVKTTQFKKYNYIGDPINTVRIFNELEVDELCFLDIRASVEKRSPNFKILSEIADECFMPLSYGGGIRDAETARRILEIGFEKVVLNTAALENPSLVSEIATHSGSQSVIGSIDFKKDLFGKYQVWSTDGTIKTKHSAIEWAQELVRLGVGEILLTAMDNDGMWSGYQLDAIEKITTSVSVPVIANGGAGNIGHLIEAVKAGASAVACGSMVVYQAKGMGVLINFLEKKQIENLFS